MDRCVICGEPCDGRGGGTAEMFDAVLVGMYGEEAAAESGIVHIDCGLAKSWEVA